MSEMELKLCPFHKCNTCGCYESVDIPDRDWNRRPTEDALRKRVAELEQQLAEVEGYPGNAADMLRLQRAIGDARAIAFSSPELNMCNYDHDEVAQLNAAMCEVCSILEDVVITPPATEAGE